MGEDIITSYLLILVGFMAFFAGYLDMTKDSPVCISTKLPNELTWTVVASWFQDKDLVCG
jgi:hypothetical protein